MTRRQMPSPAQMRYLAAVMRQDDWDFELAAESTKRSCRLAGWVTERDGFLPQATNLGRRALDAAHAAGVLIEEGA